MADINSAFVSYLFQLLLGLLFHSSDVRHGQLHPVVDPTEQLAMEVSENTLLLLKEGRWGRREMERPENNNIRYQSVFSLGALNVKRIKRERDTSIVPSG